MLLGYRKPKHHSAKYRVNDSSQFLPTKEQVEKSKTFFTHLLRTLTRQLSVKPVLSRIRTENPVKKHSKF